MRTLILTLMGARQSPPDGVKKIHDALREQNPWLAGVVDRELWGELQPSKEPQERARRRHENQ